MNNRNIVIVVLAVLVVGFGVFMFSQPSNSKAQGKVVFGIADAAKDISGVSSVLITVNKVDMHSTVDGWVTVSNVTKNYDLLVLKQTGAVSLLADVNVNAGTYDQVRLMISKVIVVKNGVSQEAKLPSGELKIVGNIVINADKTFSIIFDFQTDKSLHLTGNGKFIFSPVVKIKKRTDVDFKLKLNDEVNITGGKDENEQDFGMDEKGEVRNNFELKGNLDIDENDEIKGGEEGDEDESKIETKNNLTFNFSAQNNFSLSGTATLSQEDGKVKVALKTVSSVLGLFTSAEPAHIHFGSCASLGGVKYTLNSVVNGKSETKLNTSFADLKTGLPLAINVHKSVAESNIYIACTNLNF